MEKINFGDWKKLPNIVSLLRSVFIPLIFYLFQNLRANIWILIFILILFSLLDNLDGYIARKINQITEFGKVVDPLIDKLFIIAFAFNLYYYKLIPLWFLIVVFLRDLIIMLAGLFLIKKINKVPASDFFGKMTAGAVGVIFIMSLLNFQSLNSIFNLGLYICSILIFFSLINYGYKQFFKQP